MMTHFIFLFCNHVFLALYHSVVNAKTLVTRKSTGTSLKDRILYVSGPRVKRGPSFSQLKAGHYYPLVLLQSKLCSFNPWQEITTTWTAVKPARFGSALLSPHTATWLRFWSRRSWLLDCPLPHFWYLLSRWRRQQWTHAWQLRSAPAAILTTWISSNGI